MIKIKTISTNFDNRIQVKFKIKCLGSFDSKKEDYQSDVKRVFILPIKESFEIV